MQEQFILFGSQHITTLSAVLTISVVGTALLI
ncbi:uncharacterized protein METZ01_LOCUS185009, partial [marine metagenome]